MLYHFGPSPVLRGWQSLTNEEHILALIAAGIALLLLAQLLFFSTLSITRLYEGYWGSLRALRPLRRVLLSNQGHHWRRLSEGGPETYQDLYAGYPLSQSELLPTRLGNALKASELYARDRYGIDAVFFWPRLYFVLPGDVRSTVAEARATMEEALNFSVVAIAVAIIAAALLVVWQTFDWGPWLIVIIGCVGSRLSYRVGVAASLAFGETVRSCFDVYRHDLLKKLGCRLRARIDNEEPLWQQLKKYLYQGGIDSGAEQVLLNPAASMRNAGISAPNPPVVAPGNSDVASLGKLIRDYVVKRAANGVLLGTGLLLMPKRQSGRRPRR